MQNFITIILFYHTCLFYFTNACCMSKYNYLDLIMNQTIFFSFFVFVTVGPLLFCFFTTVSFSINANKMSKIFLESFLFPSISQINLFPGIPFEIQINSAIFRHEFQDFRFRKDILAGNMCTSFSKCRVIPKAFLLLLFQPSGVGCWMRYII